jgi:predicted nucleotidyltransferase
MADLRALKPRLKGWNIKRLRVFGSVLHGTARGDSDVDLLVEFDQTPDLISFYGLKHKIEDEIGRKVDLLTPNAVHKALSHIILNEARDV